MHCHRATANCPNKTTLLSGLAIPPFGRKTQTMSLSTSFRLFPTKFPQSFFNPSIPIFKTLIPSPPILSTFFRPITIQSIPTKPYPIHSINPNSVSLQPIEDLPPKLQEIINLFQSVQEPKAKYQQLLFYAQKLPPLDPQFKTTENKVQGCVSQVWVRAYLDSDKKNVIFEADSDAQLTKGLAALLVQGLSGRPFEEIRRVSPDFVVLLGLQQSLSASRNNGFLNMLNTMKKKALMLALEAEKGADQETESKEDVRTVNSGSDDDKAIGDFKVESSTEESVREELKEGQLGSRGERIREILQRELQPDELEVSDISYQHAGHAGVRGSNGETHFNLKVVSKEFEGKSLVKRHRLIYGLLGDELQNGLHALSIEAKTPAEVESR